MSIPGLHILNIRPLTEQFNMPFAPIPIPDIGEGSLYADERYNMLIASICLLIVSGSVLSVGLQSKRKIKDGDLCKIYNDVGETYAHAVIIDSMLEGVASTQKQYKGSLIKNGVNANALNTQEVTDMGDGPIFYTVLAQIKKA